MVVGKGKLIELSVEGLAFGGQGVARVDGFVVFIRGALPGDRVAALITRKKKAYAEARLTELLAPSPDRITAPCPYAGHCGGCQWQHLRYERQLVVKREHVRDAMTRIGTLPDVPVRDVIPSEESFGYRNKMEFSFSQRRWLLPEEMDTHPDDRGFALGLHVPGTFDKVLDVEACLLQPETGNRILRVVKSFARDSGLPAYGIKTHEGFWRFLTIRHSPRLDQWMVNVVTSEENQGTMASLTAALLEEISPIKTVVNNISARKAAVAVGERESVLWGEGTIRDRLGPFTFRVSANSFFQTNSLTAERLYAKIVDFAELRGSELVLDLYSGTGTIPIFLSGCTSGVILGMEINESAVRDAERNCAANEIANCRFVIGDIREALAASELKPDVVIIDPPRAGMHPDVLARVMELAPDRVVYVSCNPPTLARDLALMVKDYEVVEVQPVDMFPHTYHIEVVTKLVRRK
ncbi:MAG: 23S rRNA (uracil(1939)-C(5))-methyltransferase RlmD [Deltaproteobacteria bacterium]|nr:23S rRNA (uracil(1939)-C(5))-methyltransferase RlmD [Deltaproteobacteria bacterium]